MGAFYHPDADCDVLVAGGGPAGLAAALSAALSEAQVLIVTPGARRHEHSSVLALPVDGKDWVTTLGTKKQDLVQVSRAIPLLKKWVTGLERNLQGIHRATSPQAVAVEWLIGKALDTRISAWIRTQLRARKNVRAMSGAFLAEVHTLEDRVIGATILTENGNSLRIRTPRVVLGTGGIQGLFFEDHDGGCGTALYIAGSVGAKPMPLEAIVACPIQDSSAEVKEAQTEDKAVTEIGLDYYTYIVLRGRNDETHQPQAGGKSSSSVCAFGYRGRVDVDATGETTIEGLYLVGLARGWSPFEGKAAGIPLLNALTTGIISGQAATTAPPDPALDLSVPEEECTVNRCTDTMLPTGFTREKRRRLSSILRRLLLDSLEPSDVASVVLELLRLRGEARDFKRFRASPELWRLYHACEAALILLSDFQTP